MYPTDGLSSRQYASRVRPPLSRGRVPASMGSVRDAYGNRRCEIYFATLERELLDRLRFATWVEARQAIVSVSIES